MIDTDKYEGHTERPWDADAPLGIYLKVGQTISAADAQLIADTPLLLAEVKRLREIINKAMQQHTVLEMRGQLFESQCIDAEGQYESGQWERDEE